MLLFLLQGFCSFSRRNGYSLLTLLFPFPAHTFHPAFGTKYLIEEIEISSKLFPGDPQHCQFKEALPYKTLPRAVSQNPASAAPAEIPVLRHLADAKAEVVTYCVLINPPSGCSQLRPGSTSFLSEERPDNHWGQEPSGVGFRTLLGHLWYTSQNQLGHCTQNLLCLCVLPHCLRKTQLNHAFKNVGRPHVCSEIHRMVGQSCVCSFIGSLSVNTSVCVVRAHTKVFYKQIPLGQLFLRLHEILMRIPPSTTSLRIDERKTS